MKRIEYNELRNLLIHSDNPLFFEFVNLLSPRSSEVEMFSYLLDSDNPMSKDFLIASRSKYDESYISIELFCGDDSSCNEANAVINQLVNENPQASVTIYDSNGKFISYAREHESIKLGEVSEAKSYVFDDAQKNIRITGLPDGVSIENIADSECAADEIERLIKAVPDWEREVRMSYNSLGKVSDAFYIMKNDNEPIGFLCNMICTVDTYRDVAMILIAKEHRGQGFATLLAKYYVRDSLKNGKIPLYTNAENAASEKVAVKAGFRYQYYRALADIDF